MSEAERVRRLLDASGNEGAALLDELHDALTRYVVLPSEHASAAVVLWIVATHALAAFEHATRLAIHSAVKRCGKSRLLEVIGALAHRAISTTDINVAPLFRLIEAAGDRPPTILLDEADRLFGSAKKDEDNRDLIALLNNGFRRGSPTWRCVGPKQTPTPFSNYAMAAVAGIGRKPDTIEDRAVNITIRRQLPSEKAHKLRLRTDLPELHDLRDRVAAWAEQNMVGLEKPPNVPDELEDRAQDAWEPLLAVADAAGGDWPERAREAAVKLTAEAAESAGEQSLELRLLADVKTVFEGMPHVGFLSTRVLLTELKKIEDAPWDGFDFTPHKLGRRLGRFEVGPRHNSAKTERGYHLEDLYDAFRRYLRPEASRSVQTPSDLQERPDASRTLSSKASEASVKRPEETAGQSPNGQSRTLSDVPPACTCGWGLNSYACTCTERTPT